MRRERLPRTNRPRHLRERCAARAPGTGAVDGAGAERFHVRNRDGRQLYAGSTALLADALDFFADSASYGITLFVLARSARWKAGAALVKGVAMGVFGLWVIALALYRALDPALPDAAVMGGVGVLALAANAGSALLLYWHRGDDLNMRSVWLCSRNDAIANLAVILAAGAVAVSATAWPDLAAGALIAGLELSAAYSIARQALNQLREDKFRLPA